MKKSKVPSLVTLGVLTVITIIFWITFSVIRIFTSKPLAPVSADILKPITATYDKTAVDKIEKRIYFESSQDFESQVLQPSSSPSTSPAPVPTRTPVASPSATPKATASASPTP